MTQSDRSLAVITGRDGAPDQEHNSSNLFASFGAALF
jgi:hypothetical protein